MAVYGGKRRSPASERSLLQVGCAPLLPHGNEAISVRALPARGNATQRTGEIASAA